MAACGRRGTARGIGDDFVNDVALQFDVAVQIPVEANRRCAVAVSLKTLGGRKTKDRARICGVVESQCFISADQFERSEPLAQEFATWFEPAVFALAGQRPGTRDVPACRVDAGNVVGVEAHTEPL